MSFILVEQKIDRLLDLSTPVCDEFQQFESELLNIRRLQKIGDRDLYVKCGKIIKQMKRKKVVMPESMRQTFTRLYVLMAQNNSDKSSLAE
jgi:hypothetical protein